jgi:hypothetical protein
MPAKKELSIDDIRGFRREHPQATLAEYARGLSSSKIRILRVVMRDGTPEEKAFFKALSNPGRQILHPQSTTVVKLLHPGATGESGRPRLQPFELSDEVQEGLAKRFYLDEKHLPPKYKGRGVSGLIEYIIDDGAAKTLQVERGIVLRRTLQERLSARCEEVRVREAERAELMARIGPLTQERDRAVATAERLRIEVQRLQATALAEENHLLEERKKELEARVASLNEAIRDLGNQLELERASHLRTQESLCKAVRENTSLSGRVERLTRDLSAQVDANTITRMELTHSEGRVSELEGGRQIFRELARADARRELDDERAEFHREVEKKQEHFQRLSELTDEATKALDLRRVQDRRNLEKMIAAGVKKLVNEFTSKYPELFRVGDQATDPAPVPTTPSGSPSATPAADPRQAPPDLPPKEPQRPTRVKTAPNPGLKRPVRIGGKVFWMKPVPPHVIPLPGPADADKSTGE